MKVYDLKGMFLLGKKAIIAVSLPKPIKNAYVIFKMHNISDKENKIVIHIKDVKGAPVDAAEPNLELFTIEFDEKEFDHFDFTKDTTVALIHHNENDLPDGSTPQDIYDKVYNIAILPIDTFGKGTIRP